MNKINDLNIQKSPVHDRYKNIPKEYMEVAEGMETQFANQLLAEMRKTIPQNSPKSSSQKIYENFQDYERAKIIAKSQNGLGIKDVVLDQIYPTHLRQNSLNNVKMNKEVYSSKLGAKNE